MLMWRTSEIADTKKVNAEYGANQDFDQLKNEEKLNKLESSMKI